MQQVLCFGDSNTWGYDPANRGERYSPQLRWTGLLQMLLAQSSGHQWKVVEEGLNGRTTVFGAELEPHRVGLTYIAPCVLSHKPLSAIILMLGTNDTKIHYHATGRTIALGMERLLREIHWAYASEPSVPPILLIAPKPLNPDIINPEFDRQSAEKSSQLAAFYRQIAVKYGCDFLDAGAFMPFPSLDGIHLSAQEHRILGQAVADWVCKLPPRT